MTSRNVRYALHFFLLSLLFSACSDEEISKPVNRLKAEAGEDRQVAVNSLVTLDGSASTDGNQKPFSFQWRFKVKPVNSGATFQSPATATPVFIADLPGTYIIELKITQGQFSQTDEITIQAIAPVPDPTAGMLQGEINSDLVLEDIFDDSARPDYMVIGDVIVKARLTIKPGVMVQFEPEKSLQVFPGGTLIAKGTESERIFFTGREKTKGFWKGMSFVSNSSDNELKNVVVEYGGGGSVGEMNVKANVTLAGDGVSGAAVKISASSFLESGGYGIFVGGQSQLNDFAGNYFTNNTSSAVYIPAAQLHTLDFFSHYSGNNGFDGVETGGNVFLQEEVTWSYFNDGSSYLVSSDIIVESGVKITEGATFQFGDDVALQVTENGYLNATGSDFKRIVFTAHHETQQQYWKGILFDSNHDANKLHYALVSYAGASTMTEINDKANLGVSASGKVSVLHSTFEHGLGWGIAAVEGARINPDVTTTNLYYNLTSGNYKLPADEPETTSLAGEWVDLWSFQREYLSIHENYYNATTQTWFNGAADPWAMTPAAGFGLKINGDGSYIWAIADNSTWTGGCVSYNAEYIKGNVQANGNELSFSETFWRSKFYTSCDPQQNVDTNVEPGTMTLRYEINKVYNLFTGEASWELKLINPNDSFFTYYRKVTQQ